MYQKKIRMFSPLAGTHTSNLLSVGDDQDNVKSTGDQVDLRKIVNKDLGVSVTSADDEAIEIYGNMQKNHSKPSLKVTNKVDLKRNWEVSKIKLNDTFILIREIKLFQCNLVHV